jgi:HEAT repeat protein
MELSAIQAQLQNPDYQFRVKAIAALRDQSAADAIPLLQQQVADPEFLVRTFVARELGYHRTDASFATLLEMMRGDNTPNVRAEAANALSLFGAVSAAHLVSTFLQDDHWLLRRSILAALCDMGSSAEIWEVAECAIGNTEDAATREAAIRSLGILAPAPQAAGAIALLTTPTGGFGNRWPMHSRIFRQGAIAIASWPNSSKTAIIGWWGRCWRSCCPRQWDMGDRCRL